MTRPDKTAPDGRAMLLNEEALADLRYLDPKRTHDRLLSILNELYSRLYRLEAMHPEVHK